MNKQLAKLIKAVREVTAKCQKPGRGASGRGDSRRERARLGRLPQGQGEEAGPQGPDLGNEGLKVGGLQGAFQGGQGQTLTLFGPIPGCEAQYRYSQTESSWATHFTSLCISSLTYSWGKSQYSLAKHLSVRVK